MSSRATRALRPQYGQDRLDGRPGRIEEQDEHARQRRWSVWLALAAACASLPPVLAGSALADSCPNEALRSGPSVNLPDCRAYELVTPRFKSGWPVNLDTVSPDGSTLVGASFGNFGGGTANDTGVGNSYQFIRSPVGWLTTALNPPLPQFGEGNGLESLDPNISTSGATLLPAHTATQSIYQDDLYLRQSDGSFQLVGPMLPASAVPPTPIGTGHSSTEGEAIAGGSADLSHTLFTISSAGSLPPGTTTNLWPGDHTNSGTSLYEYVGLAHTGTGNDVPALVGLDNNGTQASQCGTTLSLSPTTNAPGISTMGKAIFFTAAAGGCAGGSGPPVPQLLARLGEPGRSLATVNVAGSSECAASVTCNVTAAPAYQGASADGSRVFFTTEQPLSASDHDTGIDIYECELPGDSGAALPAAGVVDPCPGLNPISVTGNATGAGVQAVVAISNDGSHVYFTATGVIAATSNQYGQTAAANSNNLYAYERDASYPAGHTAFIGQLSSPRPAAQTTPDGRFLLFTDRADLTPDDTSTRTQIFRYDAQTGELIRVSIGDQGFNGDGNTSVADAQIQGPFAPNINVTANPAISNDGSTVVFASAVGLTPQALNLVSSDSSSMSGNGGFANNLYEYRAGRVSLISDGLDRSGAVIAPVIGGSGRDVFFATEDSLVPQDAVTGSYDVYDARIGGGFPADQGAPTCQGDACQGGLSGLPPDQAAGSSTFFGPVNLLPALQGPGNPRPRTKTRLLLLALRACEKRPRRSRASCIAQARRKYGTSRPARFQHARRAANQSMHGRAQ
jgi:WD40 repeat protein